MGNLEAGRKFWSFGIDRLPLLGIELSFISFTSRYGHVTAPYHG